MATLLRTANPAQHYSGPTYKAPHQLSPKVPTATDGCQQQQQHNNRDFTQSCTKNTESIAGPADAATEAAGGQQSLRKALHKQLIGLCGRGDIAYKLINALVTRQQQF